jgi:rhamnogalacturonan endolyase
VPSSLTYTIGESKENKDWYYAQTRNSGTWTIKFNLDSRPSGRACLTASIAGCSGTGTQITVTVNGTQRATWKPGVNDACVYRSALNSGRHYVFSTDFVNTGLKAGENTVQLRLSGAGSKDGIMYDCIKLEAGDIITGIDHITDKNASEAEMPAKYFDNGRIVIEKNGVRYSPDGCRL